MKNEDNSIWYCRRGAEQDVVLSSCSSLYRNLANFPFPKKLDEKNGNRVQSVLFDAFNRLHNSDSFQSVPLSSLDENGLLIMRERGIIRSEIGQTSGLILRDDGKIACTVNTQDHLCIHSFSSGFNVEGSANEILEIDKELQKSVQFAASYEFGYLTSSFWTTGSGLIPSVCLHLPSLCFLKELPAFASSLENSCSISETYGNSGNECLMGNGMSGNSLGCFYTVTPVSSCAGNEFDQITQFVCSVRKIIEKERECRKICIDKFFTSIMNYKNRCLALSKSSILLSSREAVELIGGLKFAFDCGFISGVSESDFHALLFRVQEGHLQFLLNTESFEFESDVKESQSLQIDFLRAMTLRETTENICEK